MEDVRGETGRVAAEQDVGAAAGHVRGDRHGAGTARLGHDARLLLVELGVEDLVLDAALLHERREDLGFLDRDRADEDRSPGLRHLLDLVDQGVELAPLVAVDEVGPVLPDHRPVGRDGGHVELVDLVELLGLGHRRAGHAGQLVVEPEVVLERDRREGHALALDAQPLLGFDRLVQALAPAAAGHLAPGELVDDDDLAFLDDVVPVALVERVALERLLEVAGQPRVGVVHVLDAEPALHLVDALFGRADGAVLQVDEVVAALLGALGTGLHAWHEPCEREVQVGRLLGLAADDQRRPRFVDEDVVDLVDDREGAFALHALVELHHHVVAQVVEAEFVVRAVGDVRRVGLAARDRPEVDEALVVGRIARLEDVRRLVRDHPDADAEEVEDRSHPLRVASREVVVDGDDVDAAPGERVEDRGQRGDERLALAGPHLRDLALVEDGPADELDVEVTHVQRPLHRLAGHREDFGEDLVEGLVEALVLALAALLAEVVAALALGMVQLVVARLLAGRELADLVADLREQRADLVVGQGLVLGLECVGGVDLRLDPAQLTVVGIDESGKQLHDTSSIGGRSGVLRRRAVGS